LSNKKNAISLASRTCKSKSDEDNYDDNYDDNDSNYDHEDDNENK
jgi:hypothetical protein